MIDYAKLKTLLVSRFASLISVAEGGSGTVTQDAAILAAYNAMPGGTVTVESISQNQYLLALFPYTANILALADPKKSFYLEAKQDIRATQGPFVLADLKAFLDQAVSDGVLNDGSGEPIDYTLWWKRQGSQAEVDFSPGDSIGLADISLALRGR